MAEIKLVNLGEKAIVDDEDFEFINQFTWHFVDGHAITYDLGEPVEMGYLVLKYANSRDN